MAIKPVHITVGRKTQNSSTIPAMVGQFLWDANEFEGGRPRFRTILFASGAVSTAIAELINLENENVIATHTTNKATPQEQTSLVDLPTPRIYEVRIKSAVEGVPVTLGSAEIVIS